MKRLLLLVLLSTVACTDRTPVESSGDSGMSAAGSWWAEADDYSISLDLQERCARGFGGGCMYRLFGTGTYTSAPTEESGTFEAEGLRGLDNSNPSRAVAIWMDWFDRSTTQTYPDGSTGFVGLGRYIGTMVDSSTIEGAILSEDLHLLAGRVITLRKRLPGP
jgi:hypothetical protein